MEILNAVSDRSKLTKLDIDEPIEDEDVDEDTEAYKHRRNLLWDDGTPKAWLPWPYGPLHIINTIYINKWIIKKIPSTSTTVSVRLGHSLRVSLYFDVF